MNLAILAWVNGIVATILIKDSEKEGAVVQSTIFNCIVQFGNLTMSLCLTTANAERQFTYSRGVELLLFHVAKVFKQLLPSLTEEKRLIATAPSGKVEIKEKKGASYIPSLLDLLYI